MASARIESNPPQAIDATLAPLAFGVLAIPKLKVELQDELLITKQRALMSLSLLVHDPEKVYEAIRTGCIEVLKDLLKHDDNTIRFKASDVLFTTATHNLGRHAILDFGVVLPLAALFEDNVEAIRMNAHKAVNMLSHISEGAESVVEADLVPLLVTKLCEENSDIQSVILGTLHFCAISNALCCLNAGIVPALKVLLVHEEETIKAKSIRVLMNVCVPRQGKEAACDDPDIVPQLVTLMHETNEDVRGNAAGAIMTIAITTPGKYASLEANAIPTLLYLIDSKSTETRLYAIKALTMLAEAPEGREILLGHTKSFIYRTKDVESKAVARAAEIAIQVITWKP